MPFEVMREDDLIFSSIYSPVFDTEDGSHVGFYTGNPEDPFLSHFCDGGPLVTAVNGVYGGRERYFGVKRMKGLDMTVDDILYKQLSTAYGNYPLWELISWTYTYTRNMQSTIDEISKKLDELMQLKNATSTGLASWAYKNPAVNGNDDAYKVLTDIRENQIKMMNELDKLKARFEGERID